MFADDDPSEFVLNTRVQIVGLTSRTELNGQTGTIVGRDAKYAERWHVKLDETGNIKSFKYDNLWEAQENEKDDDVDLDKAVVSLSEQMQDTVQELSHLREEVFTQRSSSEELTKLMREAQAVLERLQGAAAKDTSSLDAPEIAKLINETVEREVRKHIADTLDKGAASLGPDATLKLVHDEVENEMEMRMKDIYEKVNVATHAVNSAVTKLEQENKEKREKAHMDHNEGTIKELAEMREQMSECHADIVELQGAMSAVRDQVKLSDESAKVLYQRLAGALKDISFLQSEVGKCGQRLNIMESRGSSDTALTTQVQALSEYLIDTGVIDSESRFLALQHRCKHKHEIKAARAVGWAPNASAIEVLQEGEVMQTLSAFSTALELIEFRSALGPAAPEKLVQCSSLLAGRCRAEGRLRCAAELVQSQPSFRSILDLQEARRAAENAGVDPDKLEEAKELIMKKLVAAVVSWIGHDTEKDLSLAIELANDIGAGSDVIVEIEEAVRINREEAEKVEKVLRRLKIATSWATSKDHERLKEAILEAEQTKLVGSQELCKAKVLLRSLQFPRVDGRDHSFSVFLKNARPRWTDMDVANATAKLEKIGIFSTDGLLEVLRQDGEEGLQTLLRDAGMKVFSEDTLKAFSLLV